MYVNGKIRSVETGLGIGRMGRIQENGGGGDFKYDIF
jgi:hypothetical protein